MQMNINPPRPPGQDPARHDPATDIEDEPVVLGPVKARAATMNRMPTRVLIISLTLTAALFAIGYLLVR